MSPSKNPVSFFVTCFIVGALVFAFAFGAIVWADATFSEDVTVAGDLRVTGTTSFVNISGVNRSGMEQDNNQSYPIRPEQWRVHDAMNTPLPTTPLSDDLGIVGGTFGTASPSLQTEDLKAAGATINYARCSFAIPPEYVTGETVQVVVHGGMLTTVADGSATVDVEMYESDGEGGIGSDLITTTAQDINSLVLGDDTFAVNAAGLAAGDVLDIRIKTTVTDASSVTVVKAIVGSVAVTLDIKG